MNRREFLVGSGSIVAGMALAPIARALNLSDFSEDEAGVKFAEGTAFHDRTGKGVRQPNDPGLAGVYVSNGVQVAVTDRSGKWRLPVREGSVLFVIKPSGWSVPVDENQLPQHFYIHHPNGSPATRHKGVAATGPLPKSIDFGLRPQREDAKFRMVLFGDPQPRNQKEIDYMAHDVIEQVIRDAQNVDAKFGISLGDIMFDDLSHYDSLNRTIGRVGIPWYNLPGNHDMNYDSPDDANSTETFKRIYGTPHCAFNYGKVHFILLDNVTYHGKAQGGYHGELSQDQLDFVKNDLATVPHDRLVVICMHIPLVEMENRRALYRLIEHRPSTLSISAHTHVAQNFFIDKEDGWRGDMPHHHLNHATVCGSWWEGAPDERGIPHATMSDGGPNGYSIVEFNEYRYKVQFRPASRPEWEQMAISLPEQVESSALAETEIVVNVFAGSPKSTVEMKIGDAPWTQLARFDGICPTYQRLKDAEKLPTPPQGLKLPAPTETDHLWKAKLPSNLAKGTHRIDIRTTDMYGQVYTDARIVRIN